MTNLPHLKDLCEKARRGKLHVGHINEELNVYDIDDEQLLSFALDVEPRDAAFMCQFSPEFCLKLLSIIEIQRGALEIIGGLDGFDTDRSPYLACEALDADAKEMG